MDFLKFHPRFSGNRDSGENLKKVLALVLAFACAFTMFAGAAFTDQADIKVDSEVVDTLVSLGVIEGFENGSFQPNGTVTRAQMAKMIYVLRTGNSDASAYNNDKTTFTDINGHWAAGYIKYCQSLNIIAGKSATKFDPNGNVTTQEAAKMLLVTLGYNAQKAGLVGTGWASKTNALADEAGLLEDVNTSFTAACPRQYAAQLIYNAIDAKTVVLRDGEYTDQTAMGIDNKTVGEKYMGLKKTVGTLEKVAKTSGKDTYELTITNVNTTDSTDGKNAVKAFTKVAKDYSALKYNTVKVLYKAKDDVYGVFATDDNTSVTGVLADLEMDNGKAKLDGTKYDLASTTTVYVDGAKQTDNIKVWVRANGKGNATYEKGTKVELLATNGSSDYSILKVTTYAVEKVTYVGKDYVTLNTSGKCADDDYNYYSDIKKDDYVVVSDKGNYSDKKGLIEKAEVVEGKIDSTKTNSNGDINKVQISGNWYKTNTAKTGNNALKLGSSVKLMLVNGYIYDIDKVTTAASDIALLVEAGSTNSAVSSKYEARLIFADGSDKVVEIKKYWEDDSSKHPTPITQTITAEPKLVTYDVSKDVYTLTEISKTDRAGYDAYIEMTAATVDGSATGSINTTVSDNASKLYFENTGIVFVRQDDGTGHDDPEFKVVSGKTAANWDLKSTLKNQLTVKAVADTSNSNLYAQVAVVNFGSNKPSGSSDKTYAVALDASYTSKENGTTYTLVKAWNGTEEKTYKYDGTISGGIPAGTIFEYSADGEDTVDITVCNTVKDRVKSYDEGTGDIVLDKALATGCKSKIDSKDTVVLFVDSDANAGVGSGEIRQANLYNGGNDKNRANVAVFSEANEDQITVLVVDVNNDITQW